MTSIDTYHRSHSFLLARANLPAQDETVFKMNEKIVKIFQETQFCVLISMS